MSFALVDAARLEDLFSRAGFHNIRVEKQTREGVIDSFEEYLEPIEAGTGSVPQIDLMLPEPERNAVRQEVKMRLAGYESGERLRMSVEMLIASLIGAAKSYIRRSRGQV